MEITIFENNIVPGTCCTASEAFKGLNIFWRKRNLNILRSKNPLNRVRFPPPQMHLSTKFHLKIQEKNSLGCNGLVTVQEHHPLLVGPMKKE